MTLRARRHYTALQKEIIAHRYWLLKRGIRMGRRKKDGRRMWWIQFTRNDEIQVEWFPAFRFANNRATNLASQKGNT